MLDGTEAGLMLTAIGAQIRAISDLHRILSASGTTVETEIGCHLSRICQALRSAVAGDVEISESFARGCDLPVEHILPVTQVFTEAVTNAIKYGHRPGTRGHIAASCRRDAAGAVVVEIRDSGPGLAATDRATGTDSLGFRLMAAIGQQLGGRVQYLSSDQGLTVRITLIAASAANGLPIWQPADGKGIEFQGSAAPLELQRPVQLPAKPRLSIPSSGISAAAGPMSTFS
jgi:two-component sensor histidine kinase